MWSHKFEAEKNVVSSFDDKVLRVGLGRGSGYSLDWGRVEVLWGNV